MAESRRRGSGSARSPERAPASAAVSAAIPTRNSILSSLVPRGWRDFSWDVWKRRHGWQRGNKAGSVVSNLSSSSGHQEGSQGEALAALAVAAEAAHQQQQQRRQQQQEPCAQEPHTWSRPSSPVSGRRTPAAPAVVEGDGCHVGPASLTLQGESTASSTQHADVRTTSLPPLRGSPSPAPCLQSPTATSISDCANSANSSGTSQSGSSGGGRVVDLAVNPATDQRVEVGTAAASAQRGNQVRPTSPPPLRRVPGSPRLLLSSDPSSSTIGCAISGTSQCGSSGGGRVVDLAVNITVGQSEEDTAASRDADPTDCKPQPKVLDGSEEAACSSAASSAATGASSGLSASASSTHSSSSSSGTSTCSSGSASSSWGVTPSMSQQAPALACNLEEGKAGDDPYDEDDALERIHFKASVIQGLLNRQLLEASHRQVVATQQQQVAAAHHQAEAAALGQQLAALQQVVAAHQAAAGSHAAEEGALRQQLAAAQEAVAAASQRADGMQQQLASAQGEAVAASSRAEGMQQQRDAERAAKEAALGAASAAEAAAEAARAEAAELQQQLGGLLEQVGGLQQQLTAEVAAREAALSAASDAQGFWGELQQQLDADAAAREAAVSAASAAEAAAEDARAEAARLQQQVADKEKEVQFVLKDNKGLEGMLETGKGAMAELEEEVGRLQQELQRAQLQIAAWEQKVQQLQQALVSNAAQQEQEQEQQLQQAADTIRQLDVLQVMVQTMLDGAGEGMVQQVAPLQQVAGSGVQGEVHFAEVLVLQHAAAAAAVAAPGLAPPGVGVMTVRGVIKNAETSMPQEMVLNAKAAVVAQRTGRRVVPRLMHVQLGPERPGMVLEVHGRDLRWVLRYSGYVTVAARLNIIMGMAVALHDLHTELQAAHFDLKQENVLVNMVNGRPSVLLCDLGYAQTAASLSAIQQPGAEYHPAFCAGSGWYMSPVVAAKSPGMLAQASAEGQPPLPEFLMELLRNWFRPLSLAEAQAGDRFSFFITAMEVLLGDGRRLFHTLGMQALNQPSRAELLLAGYNQEQAELIELNTTRLINPYAPGVTGNALLSAMSWAEQALTPVAALLLQDLCKLLVNGLQSLGEDNLGAVVAAVQAVLQCL